MNQDSVEKYFNKIEEINRQKQNQGLNDQDLRAIAVEMGIEEADIDAYIKHQLLRGDNFLQLHNYQEAIHAYEQVLILVPQNVEVLGKTAQTFAEKYQNTGQQNDKEKAIHYAQSTLQIDPSNQKAAAIITYLQGQGRHQSPLASPVISSKVWIGLALVSILLFVMYLLWQDKAKPIETEAVSSPTQHYALAAAGKKGMVFWLVYKNPNTVILAEEQVYRVDIIDIAKAKIRKSLTLEAKDNPSYTNWEKMSVIGEKVYAFVPGTTDFQARDIYSGEIVENAAILRQKFPELSEGIGELKMLGNALEITNTTGDEFVYYPETGTLSKKDIFTLLQKTTTESENVGVWYTLEEDRKLLRIALVDEAQNLNIFGLNRSPYQNYGIVNIEKINFQGKEIEFARGTKWEDIRQKAIREITLAKPLFDANVVLSYDGIFVFIAKTAIGEEGEYVMIGLDKSSDKIKWQKNQKEIQQSKLLTALTGGQSLSNPTLPIYHDKKMILFSRDLEGKETAIGVEKELTTWAAEIDLNTGKILWEKSPFDLGSFQ